MLNQSTHNTKYTAILPAADIDELKDMAAKKLIPSVNQGIRLAVESFIAEKKKIAYQQAMREAAKDDAFMARTMKAQDDFSHIDGEDAGQW